VGEEVHPTPDVVNPQPPETEPPAEESGTAFVRNTAVMSLGTALSRLTGFLRLAAMAFAIGIAESRLPDAYNVANITPNIVYELVLGGILTSVVVPVVVEWLQERGRDEAWDVVRRLLTIAFLVLSGVALVAIALAPWIVDLYTIGVPSKDQAIVREYSTFFLRWFMPQVVFYGIGAIAIGLLQAHRRFAVPMFAPVLNNLVVIATFLAFAAMDDPPLGSPELATTAQKYVLAIGTTAGVAAMTIALWPALRATGFRFVPRLGFAHAAVRRMSHLAKWILLYVAANQAGLLVVIVLADRIEGGYTAYASAFILFQLPHAIFAVSIFTALLPAMSGRWADRDSDGFRRLLAQGLQGTAAIVIPAALGYLVLARPIVRLLLEHGVAGPRSGELVSDVLVAFSVGLFPFSVFQLLLRGYYAMQDTRTPAVVNGVAVAINVAVDLFLFFVLDLGVPGLALGHAASYVFGGTVLTVLIGKRLGGLGGGRVLESIGRSALVGVATAGVAWVVAWALGEAVGTETIQAQSLQVFTAVAAGLVVFLVGSSVLRIEEVDAVRRQLVGRWRR
jgi:putative peptidoglycan lipid II flippase